MCLIAKLSFRHPRVPDSVPHVRDSVPHVRDSTPAFIFVSSVLAGRGRS